MKRAGFALALAFIIGGIIGYIVYRFPPYSAEKLTALTGMENPLSDSILTDNVNDLIDAGLVMPALDEKVLYIVLILAFVACVALVSGVHMLIDKLFYKKFYEEPLIWPAVRRGVLIYLVLAGWILLRLIGALTLINAILVLSLAGILEILLLPKVEKAK